MLEEPGKYPSGLAGDLLDVHYVTHPSVVMVKVDVPVSLASNLKCVFFDTLEIRNLAVA
jgi:hypothetical protein